MMNPAELDGASQADWDRHQRIIAGFETAWKRGRRPKIAQYLPDDEPRRDALLVELVHADLEFRIKAGESARVEDYLRRYPSLLRLKETILALIRTECSIRRRKEPGLTFDRYRRRFPELFGGPEVPGGDPSTPSRPPAPASSSTALEAPLPRRFGKFELREKLGVGSFGVVYKAWDTVLKRQVALKMPKGDAASIGPELRLIFREARNLIHLKHPHIVEMLDAVPIDGIDCMVQAYVEGKTLADRLREGPLPAREAAEMLAVVAEAIDYAHRRKVVHRDLKPSNILLDLEGRPHVMDFGLSKHGSGESTLSPEGSPPLMIGTLAYMSPEQARGETYLVDGRSDVYALGVVLYELLTGSLPFLGRGRLLLVQIESAGPIPPRELNDEVPVDLETICLKALAKDPVGRYQAASDLADDLRNFLGGRPVGAKPEAVARAARRARWKSPRRLASLGLASVTLLGLAWTTARWFEVDARRARDAEGLETSCRALLEMTVMAEPERAGRTWELLERLDETLDGDPALCGVAADVRLRLAGRASVVGPAEVAGPLWDRAIAACEASLESRSGRDSRLKDLARALERGAETWRRAGRPEKAKGLRDRAIQIRSSLAESGESGS